MEVGEKMNSLESSAKEKAEERIWWGAHSDERNCLGGMDLEEKV